ncbi:hypothetical protein [Pontibacter sp. H249]|uniref:hypothetical protein n=1 Tax=Pontibacter sp. H249 TaxID=3133420 RepID=UPI0030C1AD3C
MSDTQENITSPAKVVVSKNDCYELLYEADANRVHFTILGFWKNEHIVPELLNDLTDTLALSQSGYTLLADFSSMVTHPQQLNALHVKLQHKFIEANLSYGAYVEPLDKIANFQLDQTMEESQLKLKRFSALEDAEAWLNSVSPA